MSYTELLNEFNEQFNNVASDMAPGLDVYDISVALTQAQEEIVTQLSTDFEGNELTRRYLGNLITSLEIVPTKGKNFGNLINYGISLEEPLVIVSERVLIRDNKSSRDIWVSNVVPTKYDELNMVISNPFRCPNKFRVLRVDESSDTIRLISANEVVKYACEYLRKPNPIIVGDLEDLSIDGCSTPQTCQLDPSLHRTIIKRAVQLAASSWASNNKS